MLDQIEIRRLRSLNTLELLEVAKATYQKEANSILGMLYVLREVEYSKAFAEIGFPSLYEFCIEYLGYSKGAAHRRISAMRALRDVPEVEEKVKAGKLDITSLSQAHTYFTRKRKEHAPLKKEEKLELLNTIETLSSREAEKFFLELMPREIPKEKVVLLNNDTVERRFVWPKRVEEKIEEARNLMAAQKASVETPEVIEAALDAHIKELKAKERKSLDKIAENSSKNPAPGNTETSCVSIHAKRKLRHDSCGQCSFIDPLTGKRCNSTKRLEIDHIHAKALGGNNRIENLRLVCRAHNQLYAIQQFGFEHMTQFIN